MVGLNDAVRNAKDSKEVGETIKQFEELLKGQNRKIINVILKQRELFRLFLSKSLSKCPELKNNRQAI